VLQRLTDVVEVALGHHHFSGVNMRKALCMLFAAAFALSSLVGVASAKPAQALSCAAGNLCVWPVTDGSQNRCSFTGDNPDWSCSWSRSRPVQAVYNRNTNPNYAGVCLYPAPYYQGSTAYFLRQGGQAQGWPGVIIRSHRWVEEANEC
jgi:hypothetical protein